MYFLPLRCFWFFYFKFMNAKLLANHSTSSNQSEVSAQTHRMGEASLVVSYLCCMPWNWLELPALGTETCGRMCQQLKTAWMMTLNFYFQNKLSELSLTHPVPFTNHHARSLPLHRCHDLACLILSSLCCVRWPCLFPILDWLREVARTVMDMVER